MSGGTRESRRWSVRFAPGLSFPSLESSFLGAGSGSGDPIGQIQLAADLGFVAVFDSYLLSRPPEEQSRIGEEIERSGLVMASAIFAPATMRRPLWSSADAAGLGELEHELRRSIDAAKRGRAERLVVLTGRRRFMPLGEQIYIFAENLRRFAPLLEEEGVELCIESACSELAPHVLIQRLMDAYTVVRTADSRAVTLMFDVYHIAMTEGDVSGSLRWVADRTGAFQLSDTGRNEPGSGAFNFVQIITTALEAGYGGYFELEHLISKSGAEGFDLALSRLEAIDDGVVAALARDAAVQASPQRPQP